MDPWSRLGSPAAPRLAQKPSGPSRCVLCAVIHAAGRQALFLATCCGCISKPQAGPLWGTAVTLTATILTKRRLLAAYSNSALPCDGPQLASQGPDWGMGSPRPPRWFLLMGPNLWLWAKKMPECALCSGSKSWLWDSPQDPKLDSYWAISRCLTIVRAPGLLDAVAQPCPRCIEQVWGSCEHTAVG